ncbi:MAG: threonine/serine dehydratase [Firmicutes bacterium]|nr:threonine/serine dehydratase [Bacillota bacterium]MBQ6686516.1 threonine/serine dehydratase [Bacillota bacterium]MBR2001979.1 threonine/serine dehydratase [Bacillota bacterium]MBR4074133.1 threonine/serine dehydratase [Bacillota bacterium]MBR7147328.1 threonine/serine dehydratase [Bacillota bacterium]
MGFDYNEVKEAYERIKSYVRKTPLEESFYLGTEDQKVFFKLESFQRAKSFKIRGALNKMLTLSPEEIERGVATISSGNHGSSVSYAASLLGIKNAKVIVPETTPQSKVDKILYFGSEAMLMGKNYDEAHALGMKFIEDNGMTYIDAYYDDPKIYGGQGTIAIEILEQNPQIDTIVVPIGGGGLITGIAVAAKAIKPEIRIVGVQTENCPAMIKAYEDNVFYEEYPCEDSICDSLIGGIGALSYQMAKDYVDEFIAVSEETVGKAVSFMAKHEKYIVEAGSCVTVAALMDHRDRIGGNNVALVLSGGNIDGALLTELMNKYE